MRVPSLRRLREVVAEELANFHPRLGIVLALIRLLPPFVGSRVRVSLLRFAGCRIGARTLIAGRVTVIGGPHPAANLVVGADCWFNDGCTFDTTDRLVIGDRVSIGQDVLVLTSTHEMGYHAGRAGASTTAPVFIGSGAWLCARAIILPGVSIGDGAVVAAGAVVNKAVPADQLVAGVPARPVRELER
jgi:acetyltransferase-like isoleucine patch superfamily enzyme